MEAHAGTKVALNLTVRRPSGAAVTGLSPTVAVRDGANPTRWLDFADNTFKTTGWTTRKAALAQVSAVNAPGQYARVLDLALLVDAEPGFTFVAEYEATLDGVVGASSEVYAVTHPLLTLDVVHAVALGDTDAQPGNPGAMVVKRPGTGMPFITYQLRDYVGGAVTAAAGVVARRSEGVVTP